jgi:hypothetical protein
VPLRIILDENLPTALKPLMPGHEVRSVRDLGWLAIGNGRLLAMAEAAGFEVMITGDKNMRYQQNLAGRRIAMIVLSSSQWQTVRAGIDRIVAALDQAIPASYHEVELDRPPLRRRPTPPRPVC